MGMQMTALRPFQLAGPFDASEVTNLFLAAKSALLWLHADLETEKMSLREGDGKGGLRPYDRASLSEDDRSWIDQKSARVDKLASALTAFGYKL